MEKIISIELNLITKCDLYIHVSSELSKFDLFKTITPDFISIDKL